MDGTQQGANGRAEAADAELVRLSSPTARMSGSRRRAGEPKSARPSIRHVIVVAFVMAVTVGTNGIDTSEATTAHKTSVQPAAKRPTSAITSISLVLDGGFVPRHRETIVDQHKPSRLAKLAALVPRTIPVSTHPGGCNDCVFGTLTIKTRATTTRVEFVNDDIPSPLRALYTSLVALLEEEYMLK